VAVVHDERQTYHGLKAIEAWIAKTIREYQFQFKPLGADEMAEGLTVEVEVSAIFDGSPIAFLFAPIRQLIRQPARP